MNDSLEEIIVKHKVFDEQVVVNGFALCGKREQIFERYFLNRMRHFIVGDYAANRVEYRLQCIKVKESE